MTISASAFPGSPRLIKGGIVLMNAKTGAVQRIIVMQYNPDTLTRTLQPQGMGEGTERSQALRLKGPPVETIKFDAEIDATDQIGAPEPDGTAIQYGILPQLAELELMVYPPSSELVANDRLASQGKLEIIPGEAPLTLLVWSKSRVIPVRITDFSITEESFDPNLNPIRARVSLGMRVLSVNDLGFQHRGGNLYLRYQQEKERLAKLSTNGSFATLGITGVS
jgi:hypothetical protein